MSRQWAPWELPVVLELVRALRPSHAWKFTSMEQGGCHAGCVACGVEEILGEPVGRSGPAAVRVEIEPDGRP